MGAVARWGWRGVSLVVAFTLLYLGAELIRLDPHPGRLALWVLLLGAASILLLDTVVEPPRRWQAGGRTASAHHDWRGHDDRTAFYLRLLAVHFAARQPDDVLARRLADLTRQTLLTRHSVDLDAPEASALLGPELVHLLDAPPRRMDRDAVDRWIERIECL